jgi:hypothetical protein
LNIIIGIGFIAALIPFVIFFITKGAFNEMIDVIFRYVFSVYGQIEHNYLATLKRGVFHTFFIAEENFILWFFFIASSIYIITVDRIKENVFIVIWAAASFLFVISHREFFGYHYLVILPPFSILAGYGIANALGPQFNLKKIFTQDFQKAFILFALLVNLFFFAAINHMYYTKFFYYATGKISKEEYYAFFSAYPKHDYSFYSDYLVAQYIKEKTNDHDMIYIMGGIESVIHLLTGRDSPSRFIFSSIIFSESHGRVLQAEAYRNELLQDLKDKKPKYIISIRPIESFKKFQGIYNYLQNHYIFDKEFPDDRFVYIFKEYAPAARQMQIHYR